MIISSFFNKFWAGDIKLWKSFWIIGLLHAFILTRLIQFLETQIFKNENLFLFVQFQDVGIPIINFINLHFITKLIYIITSVYVTVGIWRSAEKHKGSFIVIFLTLIYLAFNNILPIIKFCFLLIFG
tara:strand:- start:166 stop:546 length:381 start_codon:yes stop_codon:yes gene_type:complete